MLPRLGEVLHWAAYWIAAVVIILTIAAWATGAAVTWVGVYTFFSVSVALWIAGHIALWFSRPKRARKVR